MTRPSRDASSRALRVAAACLLAALPAGADAQPRPQDLTLAETLFQEGRRLMGEGRFAEACPKLAESQRLDPGGGTLLNLGLCHEGEGRTATAWTELKAALDIARRDGRADRVSLIERRLAALEPRLARLRIAPADPTGPALELRLDGTILAAVALGLAFPVDPGPHTVQAGAPGRSWFSRSVIATAGQVIDVLVPALAAPAPPPRPAPAAGWGEPDVYAPVVMPWPPLSPRRRVAVLVTAGVAVTGIVLGSYFGAAAVSKNGDSTDYCGPKLCSPTGVALRADASRAAVIADVGLGVGAAAAVVSAYLFLVRPRPYVFGRAAVAPTLLPGGGALVVGGGF
ncbi:MAG TPA: hypothetical protein VGQ83_20680 [Polyangia bacterium]|jgi:hypothetical protein